MITLSVGATVVVLPDDLYWADELTWSPVRQSVQRSLTGALIVQTGVGLAGRPITLQPPVAELSSWLSRAALEQLVAWAQLPYQVMTLTLRSQARSVIWRHHDGLALEAQPVVHASDVAGDDNYTATLRLMEI